MGYKRNVDQIRECVQHLKNIYNFRGTLHFTDFSNLKNIFDRGYLCSRNACEENGISFVDGANHEVLNNASNYIKNCVRFYYREKTPTLYDNEGIKLKEYSCGVHIPIPVYLLFDEEIIYLDSTEFTNGNATNSDKGNTAEFFRQMNWQNIFHFGPFDICDRDYIVNKRQAELLSREPVSLKYLNKIIFRCESDKKRAINLFGYDKRYEVNLKMFSDKNTTSCRDIYYNNFISDYYFIINEKTLEISLEFNKADWEGKYTITYEVMNKNKKRLPSNSTPLEYKVLDNNIRDSRKVKFSLLGYCQEWEYVNIYLNNVLCIQTSLSKYTKKAIISNIKDYNLSFCHGENNVQLVLYREFKDLEFKRFKHKYEIFNDKGSIIKEGGINFPESESGLRWDITFNDYDLSWNRIKYYLNSILCIDCEIEKAFEMVTDDDIPF